MTTLQTVRLIAGREVRQRLRSKLFVWTTVLISLLLTLAALVPVLVQAFAAEEGPTAASGVATVATVGLLDEARADAVTAQLGPVEFQEVADEEAAAALLADRDADVDLAIIDGQRILVPTQAGAFGGFGEARARSVAEALALVDLLEEAGASELAPGVLGVTPLPVEVVGEEDPAERFAALLVANIGVVFIFGLLMFYASMIVNGIIEEKGSRVVELLVEAVPVRQLMAGKVLGLGAVAIGQAIVLFAPAIAIVVVTNRAALPAGMGGLIAMAVVWFVLGYAFYSVMCAGLGALVSRPEEAQAVLTPATLLALAGYFVGFVAIQAPDAPWSVVAGWLPPATPFVMLVRQAVGDPTPVEVAGSLALLVAGIVVVGLVAARIYEGAILRTGARVKLRDAVGSRGV